MVYNAVHTTLAPAILVALAVMWEYLPLATVGAAIWAAHIGYDRLFGYGLKYPTGYVVGLNPLRGFFLLP